MVTHRPASRVGAVRCATHHHSTTERKLLMSLQTQIAEGIRNSLSEDQRVEAVLALASELGVDSKVVPIERAETLARDIASSFSQEIKHGDKVQTPQGEAVAVILTPAEVLSRLSA